MRNWKIIVVAGLLLAWGAFSTGYGQQPPEKKVRGIYQIDLDMLSKDMAEEYLDILENLQDVLVDYGDYLEDMEDEGSEHHVEFIGSMQRRLRQGSYTDDPDRLFDDLYAAVDEIKAIERRHRVKLDTNKPRCCRLSRSLRKELVVMAELVEDYSDQQASQILKSEDVKKYIRATLKYLEKVDEMGDLEYLQALESEELAEVILRIEELGLEDLIRIRIDELAVLGIPVVPDPPEVVEPPTVIYHVRRGHKVGAHHQIQGTIQVTNHSWPIEVENPSGDIVVTGSDNDYITASLTVEVSAASHAKEKDYFNRTTLAVGEDDRRYYVQVDLPRLSDHRTELLSSVLTLSIPESGLLQCSNSFGRVVLSDLETDIEVEGENSSIELTSITGQVRVDNSTGPISLTDIEGTIWLETTYAPIMVTGCTGKMLIENEYNSITCVDNNGNLEIINTGQIEISNHEGDLFIENAYGLVEVNDIEGSVSIKNGYQPIFVSGVSGSVELENEYGEIMVEQIDGMVSASNSNGPIFAEALKGPIDLSNYFGNISVVLSKGFRGGSTITSTDGTVKLAFLEEPDLVLIIHTSGGTISSSLPIKVRTRGNTKSAELVLGDGGETLELSGSNTAVIIGRR